MRITLHLDDEIIAYARSHARRNRISLGEAVSFLAQAGIREQNVRLHRSGRPKGRLPLLPARDEVITSEHVRDLID